MQLSWLCIFFNVLIDNLFTSSKGKNKMKNIQKMLGCATVVFGLINTASASDNTLSSSTSFEQIFNNDTISGLNVLNPQPSEADAFQNKVDKLNGLLGTTLEYKDETISGNSRFMVFIGLNDDSSSNDFADLISKVKTTDSDEIIMSLSEISNTTVTTKRAPFGKTVITNKEEIKNAFINMIFNNSHLHSREMGRIETAALLGIHIEDFRDFEYLREFGLGISNIKDFMIFKSVLSERYAIVKLAAVANEDYSLWAKTQDYYNSHQYQNVCPYEVFIRFKTEINKRNAKGTDAFKALAGKSSSQTYLTEFSSFSKAKINVNETKFKELLTQQNELQKESRIKALQDIDLENLNSLSLK